MHVALTCLKTVQYCSAVWCTVWHSCVSKPALTVMYVQA